MPPIIFVLLNGLFLLLLYVFVARAVRAVMRDVLRAAPAPTARAGPPPPAARPSAPTAPRRRRAEPGELVVHPPDGPPRVVPLDGEVRFGRGASCTVVLPDTFASEQHARVYRDDGGWLVADMGSTNGTYLNQAKVTSPAPLAPGDQLNIGKTVIEVRR